MLKTVKILLLIAFLGLSIIFNTQNKVHATVNPEFDINFTTPTENFSTSDYKIDLNIKITPKGTTDISNSKVTINLNSSQEKPGGGKYVNREYIGHKELDSNTNTSLNFKFTSVPLYFNTNYFSCSISIYFDNNVSKSTECGTYYQPVLRKVNYTGPLTPLYRFYNWTDGGHFYTTSLGEKNYLLNNDFDRAFEGNAYFVGKKNSSDNCNGTGKSAVYRFWNATDKHHFFTINTAEKDSIIKNDKKWSYEGIAFCADTKKVSGSMSIYRFYNPEKKTHFYTSSEGEKNHLIQNDKAWLYEGIAYYAFN